MCGQGLKQYFPDKFKYKYLDIIDDLTENIE